MTFVRFPTLAFKFCFGDLARVLFFIPSLAPPTLGFISLALLIALVFSFVRAPLRLPVLRAKAEVKTRTRPLAIRTGKRKSAKAKKKTSVIQRNSYINPRVGGARTGIKNRRVAKPRARNLRIPAGTQAGRGSRKGNSRFRAGRRK